MSSQRALLLLSLLLILCACGEKEITIRKGGPGPPQAFEIPSSAPRVTFLGDGITLGEGLDPAAAFPNLLQATLFEAELPFELINVGKTGATLSSGHARLPILLRQQPDLLVIQLGHNDVLQATPLDIVRSELDGILADASKAAVPVLLLGVDAPANAGRDYREAVGALYTELSKAYDLPYLQDWHTSVLSSPTLMDSAGLQPTAAGQRRLAEGLISTLRELLTPKEELEKGIAPEESSAEEPPSVGPSGEDPPK